MSDLIVLNITYFQTQKYLTTLNNIEVLVKKVLIDLSARKFVHVKTSLRARCMHTCHHACNLSRPQIIPVSRTLCHITHLVLFIQIQSNS